MAGRPAACVGLLGIDAAVLTWLIYKVAIVLVTCFLGVYVPTLARSATQVSDGSFPSLPFLAVFVSGVPVQLFFPSGSGAEA